MSADLLRHPEWLGGVLAVLAAAALTVGVARGLARRRRRRLGPALRPGITIARDAALLLALVAVGAALLGPRLGEKDIRVVASGVDLVLLFDVSRSMDARDVAPSRLARARQAGEELLARLAPGDRVALAFFAGRGVLAAPLTPDRQAIAQLVRALDSELLRPAGSDLASGLRTAAGAFEQGSERPRAIFVLSDGEDPERRGELGSAAALRAEARVLAAAFGSEAGATVPDRGLPLRDRGGEVVVSRRRAERLGRLTRATGGRVFRSDEWGGFDYDAAVAELQRGSVGDADGMATRRVRAVQVWPCAALAFVLLALEGLPLPRRRATGLRLASLAAAGLLLSGAGTGDRVDSEATPHTRSEPSGQLDALEATLREQSDELVRLEAALRGGSDDPPLLEAALRERPGDPQLLIELGLERLERGRREDAMRAFRAAAVGSRDSELAALAWYDLGVAALEDGKLEEAREAFYDALALEPGDREARFNLEWTQAALEREPPPAAPPPRQQPPPQPEPPARGEPNPESGPEEETSAEQRRRWLERVEDDLGRALQAAARQHQPRRNPGPAW